MLTLKIEVEEGDAENCFDAIKEGCSYVVWHIQALKSTVL